ncbi:unnamed protein product [Polarella glacialis]|uniref:TLC domain-containing protein n=1 Tax=Polarella glacialis TaxID=89957 RepID=A0A813KRM3_POLGL|nr:unnamed protein product [Polarella glacialis]
MHLRAEEALARGAAVGAATAALAFASAVAVVKDPGAAEDVVDLCHSLYTCGVAASSWLGVHWRKRPRCDGRESEVLVLTPPAYARAAAMFRRSMGYFWADAVYILVCRCGLGHRPHQWAERLAHHGLQTVANLSCLLPGPGLEARGCLLALAYLAEASSVPLRLASLARRAQAGEVVSKLLRSATLGSFFLARLVNGFFCLYQLHAARHHLAPTTLRFQLAGGSAAYVLNLAWFFRLLRSKTSRSSSLQ